MKNTFEKFDAQLEKRELLKLKGGVMSLDWTGCTTEHTGGTYNYDTGMPDLEMLGDSIGDDC